MGSEPQESGGGWPVGVAAGSSGRSDLLCAEVLRAELATRLPGVEPTVIDAAGDGPAGPGVAVVDDRLPAATAARLRDAGWTVVPLTDVEAEGRPPVATVLADRLWEPEAVAARAAQLRLGGTLAPAGPVLLAAVGGLDDGERAALADLARAERLHGLLAGPDGPLTTIESATASGDAGTDGGERAAGPDGAEVSSAEPLDLAAAASVAGLVVTDDPAVAGLALAFGSATVGLATGPVSAGDWPAGAVVVDALARVAAAVGPARVRAADPAERRPARDRLDTALDAVAAHVREVGADQALVPAPAGDGDLRRRLAELERAHEGLRRRTRAERLAFGRVASATLQPPADDDRQRLWVQLLRAQDAEAVAVERARHLDPMEAAVAAQGAVLGRMEAELARLRAETAELAALRAEVERMRPFEAQLGELRSSRAYLVLRLLARARAVLRDRG